MAKEIIGTARCLTGYSFNFDKLYFPRGRHLRGAFGFACHLERNPLIEEFQDLKNDSLIFRDMFPLCSSCGNVLYPKYDEKRITCSRCNAVNSIEVVHVKTTRYTTEQVVEGKKYRVNFIVKDESLLDNVFKILDFMLGSPFSIGKKISSGWGRFILQNYSVKDVETRFFSRAITVSEMITPKGNIEIRTGNSANIENKFEFITLKAFERYKVVENVNGFYCGEYGNLGFGEFIEFKG